MNTKPSNKKWIRRSIGVLLLLLTGYWFYTFAPTIIVFAANALYLVMLGVVIIGFIYLIYRLLR